MIVRCPSCSWRPVNGDFWQCEHCRMDFDMFEDAGRCPYCRHVHHNTPCVPWKGGCAEVHPHLDWYKGIEEKLGDIDILRE